MVIRFLFTILSLMALFGCGDINTIRITGSSKTGLGIISGIATPFLGSIVHHRPSHSFLTASYAAVCSDPVHARLYKLNPDGTITDGNWIASQVVEDDARFYFDMKVLGLSTKDLTVKYLVKVEGCNQEVYKRPVTDFDDKQDVDYKTTVVASLINVDSSVVSSTLNETTRAEVKNLINQISGSTRAAVFTSMMSDAAPGTKFNSLFGAAPVILKDARPEFFLKTPTTNLSELVVHPFTVHTFHPDPTYSAAYSWKLDGVVQASTATWNYIPGTNDQGIHQIEIFIGKNNGSGVIDITKPYAHKAFYVTVNNTSNPVAPSISINLSTPSPRKDSNINLNIATGAGLSNCASFNTMSITESATPPGPMTYTLSCHTPVIQTETVTFSAGDGTKTLYLYARDNSGNISLPTSVSFVLDSTPPLASVSTLSLMRGGQTAGITYSASDALSGVASVVLEYSADGSTFGFVKNLSVSGTSDSFTVPSDNTSVARIRIVVTDAAGNITTATSGAITVDSIAPVSPAITLASSLYAQSKTVTMTAASCPAGLSSFFVNEGTQPLATDSGWQTCSTIAGAISYLIPTNTEGPHTLKVWSKDQAGNVSTAAVDVVMNLDLSAPVISAAIPSLVVGGATHAFTISLTELHTTNAQSISVELYNGSSWSTLTAKPLTNGPHNNASFSYSYTAPVIDTFTAKIRLSYNDLSGRNATYTSSDFKIDSTAPAISNFSINSGATSTLNNNVQITMNMDDTVSNITAFCLRYNNSAAPAAGSSCWRAVNAAPPGLTPGKSLSLSGYYMTLGFGAANYTVYGWIKDEAGHISTLTSAGTGTAGVDKAAIDYNPGTPPLVTAVIATNKDDPANPPSRTLDLVVPASSSIVIKWRAQDTEGLSSNPISIHYSTNDSDFTQIATNLTNGANGSCTVNHASTTADDTATGCYVWSGSNPGTYFKIKVTAMDNNGQASSSVSIPLNSGFVNFLAGNTSVGLDSSASSAVFQNWTGAIDSPDSGSLVVTPSGAVFFLDPNRGLLKVDPNDGLLKKFIRITGSSTGNGVDVSLATLSSPHRMALTYDNKLLIRDCNVIREVDLSTNVITTKIGGGGLTGDGHAPTDLSLPCTGSKITKYSILAALPDGDIVFSDDFFYVTPGQTLKFRKYDSATNTVGSVTLTGFGHSADAAADLSKCSISEVGIGIDTATSQLSQIISYVTQKPSTPNCFAASQIIRGSNYNPNTGVAQAPFSPVPNQYPFGDIFTGMDGRIYALSRVTSKIFRFSASPTGIAGDWETLIGTGTKGYCADGTPATTCAIDPGSAFVTSLGRLYFTDHGQIRFIDDSNNVRTLMGQRYSFGDASVATSARFGTLESLDASNNGEIFVLDQYEGRIRSFIPGANINTIAGTGFNQSPSSPSPASSRSILTSAGGIILADMHVDPVTSELYYMPNAMYVYKLDRVNNQWLAIIGTGATDLISADGMTGANVRTNFYNRNKVVAYDPVSEKLFVEWRNHNGSFVIDNFIKTYDKATGWTQSHWTGHTGATSYTCSTSTASESCDVPYLANYSYDSSSGRLFSNAATTARDVYIYRPGSNYAKAVTLSNTARSFAYKNISGEDWIYYCDSTNNVLKKQRLTDATSTALPWPSTSLKCAGTRAAVRFHPVTGNLLFIFTQDDLYGVAEYVNP